MPDRHRRDIAVAHVVGVEQNPFAFARQFDARRLTETEPFRIIRQHVTTGTQTDHGKPRIDRVFDNVDKTHVTVAFAVPVLNRVSRRIHRARIMQNRLRCHRTRRQRRRRDDRFERGARFIQVRYRAITKIFFRTFLEPVRIIRRTIGHRQNFAGSRIHHNNRAAGRTCRTHGAIESTLRKKLNLRVNRQIDTAFFIGKKLRKRRFQNRRSVARRNNGLLLAVAFDFLIKHHLYTVQTFVIDADETQHLRQQIAVRIVTFALFKKMQTGNLLLFNQRFDLIGNVFIQHPLQPHETIGLREFFRELGFRHGQ